ncbi:DEAD-like helicases superfamily domain protein [Mollivirus kamchatka]|nr:DEAD-like helicases superfamily domain protein [Mollivirus kamchatka]
MERSRKRLVPFAMPKPPVSRDDDEEEEEDQEDPEEEEEYIERTHTKKRQRPAPRKASKRQRRNTKVEVNDDDDDISSDVTAMILAPRSKKRKAQGNVLNIESGVETMLASIIAKSSSERRSVGSKGTRTRTRTKADNNDDNDDEEEEQEDKQVQSDKDEEEEEEEDDDYNGTNVLFGVGSDMEDNDDNVVGSKDVGDAKDKEGAADDAPIVKDDNDVDREISRILTDTRSFAVNYGVDVDNKKEAVRFNRMVTRSGMLPSFNALPHQRFGIQWATLREGQKLEDRQRKSGGMVADAMGLGKTLLMITLAIVGDGVDRTVGVPVVPAPNLIVTQPLLLDQWREEIRKNVSPSKASTLVYHGVVKAQVDAKWGDDVRGRDAWLAANYNFVVTTYQTVTSCFVNMAGGSTKAQSPKVSPITGAPLADVPAGAADKGLLHNTLWRRIILDEAHTIRNNATQAYKAVVALLSKRRWAVTGTPFNNKIEDMRSLAVFIGCEPYNDPKWWKTANEASRRHWRAVYMLRRDKTAIESSLPPRHDSTVYVRLTPDEQVFYDRLSDDAIREHNKMAEDADKPAEVRSERYRALLARLLLLRQACNDWRPVYGLHATSPMAHKSWKPPCPFSAIDCCVCGTNVIEAQANNNNNNKKPKDLFDYAKTLYEDEEEKSIVDLDNPSGAAAGLGSKTKKTLSKAEKQAQRAKTQEIKMARLKEIAGKLCALPCRHLACLACAKGGDPTSTKAKTPAPTGNRRQRHKARCAFCQAKPEDFAVVSQNATSKAIARGLDRHSSKTRAIATIVQDFLAYSPRNKIIIFSQWTSYLDVLEDAIVATVGSNCYERIDGSTPLPDRTKILATMAQNPGKRVLILSTMACAVGLNLVFAKGAIFADEWFNPSVGEQAEDRIHRIGQKEEVFVFHMVARSSDGHPLIEETLIGQARDIKKRAARCALGGVIDAIDANHRRTMRGQSGADGGHETGGGLTADAMNQVFADIARQRKRGAAAS